MKRKGWRVLRPALAGVVFILIVYVLVFMPLPYIIYQPGTAEQVGPMVSIPDGDKEEKGTFMLTTVSSRYANVVYYLAAKLDKNAEVDPKPKRNEAEYNALQVSYMTGSQSSAIEAAYKKAGVPYTNEPQYIMVLGHVDGVTSKGDFQANDILASVDGKEVKTFEALSAILSAKKPGEHVDVKLMRNGKEMDQDVELVELKDAETGKIRAGLGISIGQRIDIVSADEGKAVHFAKTDIGGPSAGLMFTLEIYNQLTPGDLSKGHRIAGTGTIDADGNVGEIGGVQFKIVAANREKAEVFFVPEGNYADAEKKAKSIGTSMKLVPVKTLDDALNYLDQMKAVGE
ncbi:peptidase S16 [Paenibacillus yonginensis]|uniref:endopeptidase La n=1 Tax=Paenibacillus yonginensis TaxID=1462996 RepID=A0A1B1MXN0_9BACL|nr:SepM family pheromone-processing serine protease [Paenibacillus yonginensis]ANS73943.1 peptidase S16 [Paenibacillus yonginensis]